jgi:hypothetical protein
VRVEAGAVGGAAERDLAEPRQRVRTRAMPCAHLRRVAGELLAERDRDGVHQVRAPGLDDVVELVGLRSSDAASARAPAAGRCELVERGEVHGGREDVVRRLAHVDVVVRVHALAGERRDHLVRVHVRARARAGLEDVDRELVVELAGGDPVAGGGDALGDVGVEQPEVGVRARGGGLDPAEPVRDRRGIGSPETGSSRRLLGLAAPQLRARRCRSRRRV